MLNDDLMIHLFIWFGLRNHTEFEVLRF